MASNGDGTDDVDGEIDAMTNALGELHINDVQGALPTDKPNKANGVNIQDINGKHLNTPKHTQQLETKYVSDRCDNSTPDSAKTDEHGQCIVPSEKDSGVSCDSEDNIDDKGTPHEASGEKQHHTNDEKHESGSTRPECVGEKSSEIENKGTSINVDDVDKISDKAIDEDDSTSNKTNTQETATSDGVDKTTGQHIEPPEKDIKGTEQVDCQPKGNRDKEEPYQNNAACGDKIGGKANTPNTSTECQTVENTATSADTSIETEKTECVTDANVKTSTEGGKENKNQEGIDESEKKDIRLNDTDEENQTEKEDDTMKEDVSSDKSELEKKNDSAASAACGEANSNSSDESSSSNVENQDAASNSDMNDNKTTKKKPNVLEKTLYKAGAAVKRIGGSLLSSDSNKQNKNEIPIKVNFFRQVKIIVLVNDNVHKKY